MQKNGAKNVMIKIIYKENTALHEPNGNDLSGARFWE